MSASAKGSGKGLGKNGGEHKYYTRRQTHESPSLSPELSSPHLQAADGLSHLKAPKSVHDAHPTRNRMTGCADPNFGMRRAFARSFSSYLVSLMQVPTAMNSMLLRACTEDTMPPAT